MFRMKSSKFENIIVCLEQSIPAGAELWNTITIKMAYDNKNLLILLVEDEDVNDVVNCITPDYVGVDNRKSFMHTLAVQLIYQCAVDALRNIINSNGTNTNEFRDAFQADTEFDRDIWEHACSEVKHKLLTSILPA